ncbi:ABC transporter ATP-binding protein [Lutispora sp.]|uniref:ABC transporter ATP-binding protein n=1 Tax=Lutispora sp. TaxID=2828727 RepID=UPI002B2209C9|nr:ABC transporter ATP-binding protein [Lutispora sp.]MEA4960162.1 ABC transporter ATP-binding protein [Lutispora sp.]
MLSMIFAYIKQYKLNFIVIMICSTASTFASVAIPYVTGMYIDKLVDIRNLNEVYYFTIALTVIIFISIGMSYIKSVFFAKFNNRVLFDFIDSVMDHVKALPLSYFRNKDIIYLNDRINSDCSSIVNFVTNNIINVIMNIISLISYFLLIYKISNKMLIALLCIIPLYLFAYNMFSRPLYNINMKYKEEKNKYISKMLQQISNIKFIKLHSLYQVVKNQFQKSFEKVFNTAIKTVKISYLFYCADNIIRTILTIILFFWGGIEIIHKRMSVGNFTIINRYFSMIFTSISYFFMLGQSYQDSLVSYNRIRDIMRESIENNGSLNIDDINIIELKNVSFFYENRKIIVNFNYKFRKGNIYYIVGANGIGKSTFVSLLVGIEKNYKGSIFYDDINIDDIDLYNARRNLVGIVEQSPKFISGTLKYNLTYNENIEEEYLLRYFKKYNAYEFLCKLPDGFDTLLENGNLVLSDGEKQKISIIRAVIKNPKILILDEPTTALDTNSIAILKRNLIDLKKDKIIIIITHDYNLIDKDDSIIDMGKVNDSSNKECLQ